MATPVVTLGDLANMAEAEISGLQGDPVLVARLRELGFIRGAHVKAVGRALFGEPILIEIRGAVIALRKQEAQCVLL